VSHRSNLPRLPGAEVESVVFVRDYLQLTLYLPESSPILTCFGWPIVEAGDGVSRSLGDSGYRDALCALIGRLVVACEERAETGVKIEFEGDWSLALRPAWSELDGAEIAMLQMNDEEHAWDVWRPGEPPFEADHWA